MDSFQDTASQYYKDLNTGKADQKDFERYIYGQYGAKGYSKDQRDTVEEKAYEDKKKIENDFKAYVDA